MREACSGMDRSDARVGIPAATLKYVISTLINTAGVSTNDMFGTPCIEQQGRRTVSTFSTVFVSLMGMAAGGLVVTQLTDVMFNSLDGGTPIWNGQVITMPSPRRAPAQSGMQNKGKRQRGEGGGDEDEGETHTKGAGGSSLATTDIPRTAPSPWYCLDPKGIYGGVKGEEVFAWQKRCFFCGSKSCNYRENCQNTSSFPPLKRTMKRMGGTLYVQGRTREEVRQLWEGYCREF